MPKRTDLKKILLIGSGPIIIGQACEFDYSGSQACKALKEEGYRVVLVNSNPATIMTDPGLADATYIEPLSIEFLTRVIEKERPDALLPTLGGQVGLNLATFLAREGVLEKYGVEMIGADAEAIARAETRDLFKKTMQAIGVEVPASGLAYSVEDGIAIAEKIGFPLILRPAYTLGGTGGSTVYNLEELKAALAKGIEASPIGEVLVEESVLGWKEIEFEVMRDCADNTIIVTSMENVDPMGVHTGDSIVVAPAQTLTSGEYGRFAELCRRIIRAIGINGGGANIQFGLNPENGRIVIIEVNPRLSRSSALASKATGFPIARIATKLAVGFTLDEVRNEITGRTSAFYEPTVDYCVFKIARFTFEKFAGADPTLNTSMKSVGEVMSIGRTFKESLQKGLRALETGRFGLGADGKDGPEPDRETVAERLRVPNGERLFYLRHAIRQGFSTNEIYRLSRIDPWFIGQIRELVEAEAGFKRLDRRSLRRAKEYGFSDRQLACLSGLTEVQVRSRRKKLGIEPVFKLVDTCASEIEVARPYFYSSYDRGDECRADRKRKVAILGGGPNRIGQGIEFDYCCVHASFALREAGYQSIMVNCNPETVSTDYDTSDRLYFEPLTLEDVLNIVERERPLGAIVQFGGQTPLNLAIPLQRSGLKILGTSPDSIDRAEDRKRFSRLLNSLRLQQAPNGTASSFEAARKIAESIGYPVLVRPSYVLGGRAMEIVYDTGSLTEFMAKAVEVAPEHPVLIDKFLEDAIEVDVDAICDRRQVVVAGVMEHIEEAGIHSGDSAMVLPTYSLSRRLVEEIKEATGKLALALKVCGLINIQFAVKENRLYVLEVNPRASRTVPFVSKVIGVPLANLATKLMLGSSLEELGFTREVPVSHFAVKESVFPFNRFPGVDTVLGPEMRSTGEVMGLDSSFERAYAKSQLAAGQKLPRSGRVFLSVRDRDKSALVPVARGLHELGFELLATAGTGRRLAEAGVPVRIIPKVSEGRPNIVDHIKDGEIALVINTPSGQKPRRDITTIRAIAVSRGVPLITTMPGAKATFLAIKELKQGELSVRSLQEYHAAIRRA
ncbi:MAG TPA: carbamoyl-phosphate synthase large subunit [bacterium]|nr:carbamoyl-phosphate synthase large subunit [bacterium]